MYRTGYAVHNNVICIDYLFTSFLNCTRGVIAACRPRFNNNNMAENGERTKCTNSSCCIIGVQLFCRY